MQLVPWRKRDVWQPFSELESLQSEMNKLFDLSLGRWPGRNSGLMESAWSPAVDVFDSKDNVMVKADIPGLKKEDIEISVHADTLTIKGEKKEEKETKDKNYVKTERFYGSFNRTIALPSEVDASKVKASYKEGVLEIVLPKKDEAKPKQIKVNVD
ncbi:MAG TPA: Hsp20/alpha crystallin family protein [Candidatus Omnitrophota bacterium]|nr:Hsp20/alpha crystallin family protein [Candidatus Omnitrophota bacterium]